MRLKSQFLIVVCAGCFMAAPSSRLPRFCGTVTTSVLDLKEQSPVRAEAD